MNFDTSHFKNIDKSSVEIFADKNTFTLLNFQNEIDKTVYNKYVLDDNFIQLYFSLEEKVKVAFNMPHCAINVSPEDSGLIYFKEEQTNLLFTLPPKGNALVLLISVPYFHSLFTHEGDYSFNFNTFKGGKPVIEEKAISPSIKNILQQIVFKNLHGSLRDLYTKGKIYELLSLYFTIAESSDSDHCPFIANEETISQIKQAKDIIIENMANPPSLEELSKAVGLNLKKLKIGFKEFYGAPVFSFLLNYKLDYSKKMLEENKLNVSEIGLLVGYSTSSHFIAAFKKKFGITPKQFTKQENE
jgi:AraC family transcriptional regulator, transcriptional activator of the genes for pyochelin and ferripyochelin receptors